MSESEKYKAPPSWFDLSNEVADGLQQAYVVEVKSMDEAIQVVRMRTGAKFSPDKARRFIRANGWKRSPRFYARRSPWQGHARVAMEERKARDRMTDERDS